MRLEFNLVLILVFGSGVAIASYLSHEFLERSARDEVLEQARLMMGAASIALTGQKKFFRFRAGWAAKKRVGGAAC